MEHLVVQPSSDLLIARGQLGRGLPIALMSLPTPTAPTSPRTTKRGLASGSAPVALAANVATNHTQPFAQTPDKVGSYTGAPLQRARYRGYPLSVSEP